MFTGVFETAVKLFAIQKPLTPFSEILPMVFSPNVDKLTPVTVTGHVAVLPPSSVVTVMVALPSVTPVARPVLLTVTTDVLSELQVTVLLVAFEGEIVAINCCAAFIERLAESGFTVTLVTIVAALTVMMLVAVLLPSCVVTVMLALPPDTAVTSPVPFTVATELLSELQVTVLLVAFEGEIVAVNCCVAFIERLAEGGLTVTPVTAMDSTIPLKSA